jgi:tRNA-uridine 2-sulfurtransferase
LTARTSSARILLHFATGHFARVQEKPRMVRRSAQARTRFAKDQSYFLFSLRQDQLGARDFSARRKDQERHARSGAALPAQDRRQGGEHGNLFRAGQQLRRLSPAGQPGAKASRRNVDLHGHVLGHHDGIEFYTIGQRKGLGITTPKPVYVVELDAENNRVVVGDDSALDRDEFTAERCNWHPFDNWTEPIEVTAKIRYNHPGTAATVTPPKTAR